VVIAIISVLMSIMLPALAGARQTARNVACSARLQQQGVALQMYWNDYDQTMPQYRVDVGGGQMSNIATLYGGKKGTLGAFGINEVGAERRPLNRYLELGSVPPDSDAGVFQTEIFRSPCDRGGDIPGIGPVASVYDLLGTSYTVNDHDLRGDSYWTLIPPAGGRMPYMITPTKTWVIASQTVYNHQATSEGGSTPGNRGMRWYGQRSPQANMLFSDLHVAGPVTMANSVLNTTSDYTFLPQPEWNRGPHGDAPQNPGGQNPGGQNPGGKTPPTEPTPPG
jgi:competence protein ComGC